MTEALRAVLSGPVEEAARALLGCRLTSTAGGDETAVVLTEVEAYGGSGDPASHAFRGRTPRNKSMFGQPGHLYVYRSYGVHWCMNVVTGPEGEPSAVLLRAGRPTAGADVMARRRGRDDHLTDGPGKLAQALGVDGTWDGVPLLAGGAIALGARTVPRGITAGPRIGITKAAGRPWRFVATEE